MMIYLDIKRIVFSSKDNTFISENPKNLTIKHESAGNKFLRKKNETQQIIKKNETQQIIKKNETQQIIKNKK